MLELTVERLRPDFSDIGNEFTNNCDKWIEKWLTALVDIRKGDGEDK
jgi:hypothetical protein